MVFAGINYLAVLVAAIAGFAIGSVWYMILGNAWMNALGKTREELKPTPGPFIAAFLMQLLMAYILAGAMGHLGENTVTVKNGVISAAFCWAGFVLTTMFVNHRFQGSPLMLTVIDAGHWLFVLLGMGIIIGLFGI
ncbi:MAG: DUF1761 domain-containing protein [Methyloligellaceae bacterium]